MAARTQGREYALQVLYQCDANDELPSDVIDVFWAQFEPEVRPDEEVRQFAEELARGVESNAKEIDDLIESTSINWRLERMPRVDRNVLRIAVFELIHRQDVPVAVVINEAIEIGKRYGSEESGSFINGILDRVAQELGRTP